MDEDRETKPLGQVIRIDDARIRDHLGEIVRGTVEEALNAMLYAEADRLCGAGRYKRSVTPGKIPEPAAMIGSLRPVPVKSA